MNKIAPYWKAVVGFVAPGATLLIAAMQDGSAGGSVITQNEWVTAALTCVITSGAVLAKGNKDKEGTHQDESVQPPAA